MNNIEFCELFKEEMGIETSVNVELNTDLSSIEEWDSMGYLVTITFINDHFNKNINLETIKDIKKVKELYELTLSK